MTTFINMTDSEKAPTKGTNSNTNGLAVLPSTNIPFEDRPAAYGWKTTNEHGYQIQESPSGSRRRLRVIGVGAGASGINLAKAIRDDTDNIEVVVYDKNPVRIHVLSRVL